MDNFCSCRKLFAAAFLRCRTRVQPRGNFGCWRILESLWRKSESCSASLMHQNFGIFGEEFLEHVPVQEEAPGGGGCPSLSLCVIWEEFCSSSSIIRRRRW